MACTIGVCVFGLVVRGSSLCLFAVACRDFGPQLTKRFLDFLARYSAMAAIEPPSSGGNCLADMTTHSMSERASVRMPCTSRFLFMGSPYAAAALSGRMSPTDKWSTAADATVKVSFGAIRAVAGWPCPLSPSYAQIPIHARFLQPRR